MIKGLVRGINGLRRVPRTINKKTRGWIKVMRSSRQNHNGPTPKVMSDIGYFVLKTEMESTQSESGSSQEIVKNQNAENIFMIEKNESFTQKLDNLKTTLDELKSKYLSSIIKKDSNHRIDDLERELDQSTLERKDAQQRIGNQEQDAGDDIIAIGDNLKCLKRQNAALNLRMDKSREPMPSCCTEYDERIKGLQRKLDELEEAYMYKAQRYKNIIAKIIVEARREKECREKLYETKMKLKENQMADIIEKYDVEREKVAELSSHINGLKTPSTANDKPLASGKKLAKDKHATAVGKKLAIGKPQTAVKTLNANASKFAGPSGDGQRVGKSPNVALGNKNATKETKTKTSVTTYKRTTNEGNRPAKKLVKKAAKQRSDDRKLIEIYHHKQRERDKWISDLRKKIKQQKAFNVKPRTYIETEINGIVPTNSPPNVEEAIVSK